MQIRLAPVLQLTSGEAFEVDAALESQKKNPRQMYWTPLSLRYCTLFHVFQHWSLYIHNILSVLCFIIMNNSCWGTLNYPIVTYFTVCVFCIRVLPKISWIKKNIKSLLLVSKYCSKMVSVIPNQDIMGYIVLDVALINQRWKSITRSCLFYIWLGPSQNM